MRADALGARVGRGTFFADKEVLVPQQLLDTYTAPATLAGEEAHVPLMLLPHRQTGQQGLFVAAPVRRSTVLATARRRISSQPSSQTIQVGAQEHMEVGIVEAAAHSCAPSCVVEVARDADGPFLRVRALRDLPAGSEVSYNYLTTEYDMYAPFPCRCGAAGCFGAIAGFRYLPMTRRLMLLRNLAPHLRALVESDGL